MKIIYLAFGALLLGCVNLDTICPHKVAITQGVFGEILDSSGALEQNVEVDIFTMLSGGAKGTMFGNVQTTRGGYQINADAGSYILCAKTVCTTIAVPTGIVEYSATDAATGLTWDAPVSVPPAQMIGPCTYGS